MLIWVKFLMKHMQFLKMQALGTELVLGAWSTPAEDTSLGPSNHTWQLTTSCDFSSSGEGSIASGIQGWLHPHASASTSIHIIKNNKIKSLDGKHYRRV